METKMGTKVALLHLLVLFAVAKGNIEKLRCPPRVERFSSNISRGHFYQCNAERYPVLIECPQGQLYHMQKQKCLSKEETPKNKAFDEKSMGRNFILGSLYDAKKSQVFDDSRLWDKNTINAAKFSYDRKEVNTAFTADKTVHDKTSHFDISAKLSMEFMGGMVSVSGAMSYLDDDVSSEREVNVEMLYHTTKYTETLPKKTPISYMQECGNVNDPYTHVVTSITYGLDCNFVFKYLLADHETESSITGELGITINNIPSFSISGAGKVNLTESEQSLMEHTSLTMFGDFSLEEGTIPTNFEEACRFYEGLPALATTQASILEVHMTPIEDICNAEDYILNEISDSMMASVINMLDELNQLEIKARGLMNTNEADKFPALKKNLNTYQKALTQYVNEKQALLQDLLPKIRAGDGQAEDDLIALINGYTKSPFEFETSDEFLIDRNREILAIRFLLASFPDDAANIAVVDYEQGTDVEFILYHDYVIILDFKILTPPSLTNSFLAGDPQSEENFWYNSIAVNGQVGSLLRNFSSFALENAGEGSSPYGYMINCMVIDEGEDDPTTMTAFLYGGPISTNYVVASAPLEPYIHEISYDEFKFTVPRFNEFTTGLKVTITNVYEGFDIEQTINWEKGQGEEDFEIVINASVEPATVYSVVAQYTTEVGLGPKSVSSRLFITAPSSPPEKLTISDITTNSLRVLWDPPAHIGAGIQEDDLIYSVQLTGEDGYVEKKTTSSEHEFLFENLVEATKYNVEAKSYIEATELGFANETINSLIFVSVSQPAIIYQNSNPFAPKMIPSMPGEVTTNSAILRWEPPTKLPDYDTLTYNLVYVTVDAEGNTLGEEQQVSVEDVHYELTGLPMATMYDVKVQVVTNLGQSDFSAHLVVKTQDEESEIGHFGDEIKEDLENIINNMKRRSSFCASISGTNAAGTITYEKLFLDQNNVVGAALDTAAGTFTAGATGSYQVMISAEVVSNPGQQHNIWVATNGDKLAESLIHSMFEKNMFGDGYDNASRDIVLKLNAGDTVSISHETDGAGQLVNVIFCVSSIKLT